MLGSVFGEKQCFKNLRVGERGKGREEEREGTRETGREAVFFNLVANEILLGTFNKLRVLRPQFQVISFNWSGGWSMDQQQQ